METKIKLGVRNGELTDHAKEGIREAAERIRGASRRLNDFQFMVDWGDGSGVTVEIRVVASDDDEFPDFEVSENGSNVVEALDLAVRKIERQIFKHLKESKAEPSKPSRTPMELAQLAVWPTLILLAGFAVSLAFAFARPDGPKLGYVEGRVTLDGVPLPGANIEFEPEQGSPSYGQTDENGRYVLMFTPEREGAFLGVHTVRISTYHVQPDPQTGQRTVIEERVPESYNTSSTARCEVIAGRQEINFDIRSGT